MIGSVQQLNCLCREAAASATGPAREQHGRGAAERSAARARRRARARAHAAAQGTAYDR